MVTPLLTKSDIRALPKLYETESIDTENKVAVVKLYMPNTNWTWYVIEFDGVDTCFGFVIGDDSELGYFSLKELSSLRVLNGMRVERDDYFDMAPLRELMYEGL